jgi:tagatose-1,6-bisphosphate aldolase
MNLPSIQNQHQVYSLLELDQAPRLAESLSLDLSLDSNVQLITQLLKHIITATSQHVSGLVIDPIYSLEPSQHKAKQAGLLSRLSVLRDEVDPLAVPSLFPNWSIADISNNYALAKLELYYHPQEEQALAKKQLVAELADYCQYQQIDFLLKLIIYTPADQEFSSEVFQQDQLQAVQEFRNLADIIALQYPRGPLATATVTAELDIPWLLFARNEEYNNFKELLRISLENGAKGFLAGQSFWYDLAQFRQAKDKLDFAQIKQYINTDLRDRVLEAARIVDEQGASD